MNVLNVLKPFHITIIFNCITEYVLERNALTVPSAFNMVKPSCISIVFINMKEVVLEKNYVKVFNMGKSLIFTHHHHGKRNYEGIDMVKPLHITTVFIIMK